MKSICSHCKQETLEQAAPAINLFPDAYDEITLWLLHCKNCNFYGIHMYEESQRGKLDSEVVHEWDHPVSRIQFQRIQKTIQLCTNPGNALCPCEGHITLNKLYKENAWNA